MAHTTMKLTKAQIALLQHLRHEDIVAGVDFNGRRYGYRWQHSMQVVPARTLSILKSLHFVEEYQKDMFSVYSHLTKAGHDFLNAYFEDKMA